ncbi:prolyl oligopeptidase family serine peptidase [Krasilnikovia sp. MM14-A1004]|uniref:prolyl oligopeptidase family serine peptidase n=1 Tax=Krasilnikovia sp. MM14-A1004 TaxID=3373541 RepID=UPI00399CC7A1
MLVVVEVPTLTDQAGGAADAPDAVVVGADGSRVVFLRAGALWVHTVATGAQRCVTPGPVDAYGVDAPARTAAFAVDGRLHRADLVTGEVAPIGTPATADDPHPDPTGTHIGYLDGDTLRVTAPDGADELLAGEPGVRWGGVDEAGAQFGRTRGWWWAPGGGQILAVRSAGSVSLHLLDLYGGWVDVHWDRETYPYLVDVHWGDGGGPLITVLRRTQQHGLVLSIDPRTGETQVHAELADARWVEPVAGTPRHLPDGRVLVGGELAHDGFDARCLFADGSLLTPPGLYVRRVVGVLPRAGAPAAGPDLIVEGTDGEPAEQHVFAIRTALVGGGADARRLTTEPGWHRAEVGGDVVVLASASLAGPPTWTIRRGDAAVGTLCTPAPAPARQAPQPALARVTDRRLPAAVLYPPGHLSGNRLPVLVEFGLGPGHQQVVLDDAAWRDRRWWAAAGFAVVSVDSRGTPGVAPSFEKVVHRRLADVVLADQADALLALTGKNPDLELTRVAVRGTGLGGWLAALAVTRRHDLFRCAVARDPVTDFTRLPTALAERYLGRQKDSPEVYAHHRLAGEPVTDALLVLDRAADMTRELDFIRHHTDRLER